MNKIPDRAPDTTYRGLPVWEVTNDEGTHYVMRINLTDGNEMIVAGKPITASREVTIKELHRAIVNAVMRRFTADKQ